MTFRVLLTIGLVLMCAERLPAPIQEVQQTTPIPKPKREAISKPKSKADAIPNSKARHSLFAGTWSGSTVTTGTDETCFYVIKVSDDEKTVLISWKFGGKTSEFASGDGPPELAACTRFGNALSWSPSSLKQIGEVCTDTLQLNSNGTATFTRTLTSADKQRTFSNTGALSRQGASSAPSIRQTTTVSAPQTTTRAPPTSGFPTAKRVPGNSNLVFSPFDRNKYIDVEGYASGTECKDPYTGKTFIVP